MKKILLFFLLLIPITLVNAEGISISTNSISLKEGNTKSFTIDASSCAGRVDIMSSDDNVVSVSSSKEFLDNNQVSIKLTGTGVGNAVIIIKLTDIATYSEAYLVGTKTINVDVKENDGTTIDGSMIINKFEVVGYNLNFDPNTYEYTIDVSSNVKELYLVIEGENFTSSSNGKINIEGLDEINISLKNEDEIKNYTIKLNKEESVAKKSYIVYYVIGFFALIILVSVAIIIISRKDKKTNQVKETTLNIPQQPNNQFHNPEVNTSIPFKNPEVNTQLNQNQNNNINNMGQ